MESVSRRRFLQLGAGMAAAATLGTSCAAKKDGRGMPGAPKVVDPDKITTTSLTQTQISQLHQVQHVVILLQGGASFDQVFGTRKGARGFGDPDVLRLPSGTPIWGQPAPTNPDGYVLPFRVRNGWTADGCQPLEDGWDSKHASWDRGQMDRFAVAAGPQSMGYYNREDLPWYHALADEFTLCDAWFSSALAPSEPNRLMAMTGTLDPYARQGGPAIDGGGVYAWETYAERLERAGIGWGMYAGEDAQASNALAAFVQFQEAAHPSPLWKRAMKPRTLADFTADCHSGDLPWVSWIAPPDAPASPADQQQFAAHCLSAITANRDLWASTVFIVAHADSGGAFDHVPPPRPPEGTPDEFVAGTPIGLGFRVPALVVSPWSRGGKVNQTVVDHTSILRFLELRFGVLAPAISQWRRDNTGDLLDTLDFDHFDPSVPDLGTVPKPLRICPAGTQPAPPGHQSLPQLDP